MLRPDTSAGLLGAADNVSEVITNRQSARRPLGCYLDTIKAQARLVFNPVGLATAAGSRRQNLCRCVRVITSSPSAPPSEATTSTTEMTSTTYV